MLRFDFRTKITISRGGYGIKICEAVKVYREVEKSGILR